MSVNFNVTYGTETKTIGYKLSSAGKDFLAKCKKQFDELQGFRCSLKFGDVAIGGNKTLASYGLVAGSNLRIETIGDIANAETRTNFNVSYGTETKVIGYLLSGKVKGFLKKCKKQFDGLQGFKCSLKFGDRSISGRDSLTSYGILAGSNLRIETIGVVANVEAQVNFNVSYGQETKVVGYKLSGKGKSYLRKCKKQFDELQGLKCSLKFEDKTVSGKKSLASYGVVAGSNLRIETIGVIANAETRTNFNVSYGTETKTIGYLLSGTGNDFLTKCKKQFDGLQGFGCLLKFGDRSISSSKNSLESYGVGAGSNLRIEKLWRKALTLDELNALETIEDFAQKLRPIKPSLVEIRERNSVYFVIQKIPLEKRKTMRNADLFKLPVYHGIAVDPFKRFLAHIKKGRFNSETHGVICFGFWTTETLDEQDMTPKLKALEWELKVGTVRPLLINYGKNLGQPGCTVRSVNAMLVEKLQGPHFDRQVVEKMLHALRHNEFIKAPISEETFAADTVPLDDAEDPETIDDFVQKLHPIYPSLTKIHKRNAVYIVIPLVQLETRKAMRNAELFQLPVYHGIAIDPFKRFLVHVKKGRFDLKKHGVILFDFWTTETSSKNDEETPELEALKWELKIGTMRPLFIKYGKRLSSPGCDIPSINAKLIKKLEGPDFDRQVIEKMLHALRYNDFIKAPISEETPDIEDGVDFEDDSDSRDSDTDSDSGDDSNSDSDSQDDSNSDSDSQDDNDFGDDAASDSGDNASDSESDDTKYFDAEGLSFGELCQKRLVEGKKPRTKRKLPAVQRDESDDDIVFVKEVKPETKRARVNGQSGDNV